MWTLPPPARIWTPCAASHDAVGHASGRRGVRAEREGIRERTVPGHESLYRHVGQKTKDGGSNPYAYGYKFELSVTAKGESRLVKHYSMGRLANELGDVMPDKRTAYMGDDGRDTVMFMYVADKAEN